MTFSTLILATADHASSAINVDTLRIERVHRTLQFGGDYYLLPALRSAFGTHCALLSPYPADPVFAETPFPTRAAATT
ncbi:hypothetical protein ABH922_001781 [Rhodococcus sp. 27YEA15]